jgi:hypothetical protein
LPEKQSKLCSPNKKTEKEKIIEYFPHSVDAVAQRRFVIAVSQGYKPCESKGSR